MPICLITRLNDVVRPSPPAAKLGNGSFRFIPESCLHVNQRAAVFAARPDPCNNGDSCGLTASLLAMDSEVKSLRGGGTRAVRPREPVGARFAMSFAGKFHPGSPIAPLLCELG